MVHIMIQKIWLDPDAWEKLGYFRSTDELKYSIMTIIEYEICKRLKVYLNLINSTKKPQFKTNHHTPSYMFTTHLKKLQNISNNATRVFGF